MTTDSSAPVWLWLGVRSWRSLILSSSLCSRSEDDQFWDQTPDQTEVRVVSSPVWCQQKISICQSGPARPGQRCEAQCCNNGLLFVVWRLQGCSLITGLDLVCLTPGQILSYTNYTEDRLSSNVKHYTKLSESNIATFHLDDPPSLILYRIMIDVLFDWLEPSDPSDVCACIN